ncbi:hypothetical protein [Bacillus sp. M6-12]|uniref:hypothetical protein n=1 Tax=Bacillus sp. M6-12 TaxID=2054166 RepID=UPI0015E09DE0|nr:hypothetical protein [Bacillus sp. M6-12]
MFKLEKIEEKCADICEQCCNEEKPIYHLKGKYDNMDSMLCKKCLDALKETINKFEM